MYRQSLFNRPDYSSRYPVYNNYNNMYSDGSGLFANEIGGPLHLGSWLEYSQKVREFNKQMKKDPNATVKTADIRKVAKKYGLPPYHDDASSKKNYGEYYSSLLQQQKNEKLSQAAANASFSPAPLAFPVAQPVPIENRPVMNLSDRQQLISKLNALRKQSPCNFTKKYLNPLSDDVLRGYASTYSISNSDPSFPSFMTAIPPSYAAPASTGLGFKRRYF